MKAKYNENSGISVELEGKKLKLHEEPRSMDSTSEESDSYDYVNEGSCELSISEAQELTYQLMAAVEKARL